MADIEVAAFVRANLPPPPCRVLEVGAGEGELATALAEERKQVESIVAETREVATWLHQREQSASITGLYGN